MKPPDNKKILIVEDELLVAEDIAFRLRSLGYQITNMVISGKDSIDSVKKETPDLILMDIMLKGDLDGSQTHEILNESYDIPLVYLTSYSDDKTFTRAKLTHPLGYIIKPFDERDLQMTIEMALYKHSMDLQLQNQLKSEELISRISTNLLSTKTEDLDFAIVNSLKLFGEYTKVDKCFVFLFNENGELHSPPYEWRKEESYLSIKNLENIPVINLGWAIKQLYNNEVLTINKLSEMPEEAGAERDIIKSLGVKSTAAVGLKYGDKIKGILGFDSIAKEKKWKERETLSIKLFSKILANTLERKHIEEQLVKSQKNLLDLNAAKDKFFSIIAHDLKNPFMGILGFTEILSNSFERYDDEEKKMISFIRKSVESVYKLLDNLLEWSRVQIGATTSVPAYTDISVLINEAITSLKEISSAKNIKIVTTVENETFAYCDEEMIKSVIRNLLTNAIKFSHPGGYVKITSQDTNENVKLSITDKGVGIKKGSLDNLFRIDKPTTAKGTLGEKGSGLGLILCKEFIKKNNGELIILTVENEGSTFTVVLPAKEHTQNQ